MKNGLTHARIESARSQIAITHQSSERVQHAPVLHNAIPKFCKTLLIAHSRRQVTIPALRISNDTSRRWHHYLKSTHSLS